MIPEDLLLNKKRPKKTRLLDLHTANRRMGLNSFYYLRYLNIGITIELVNFFIGSTIEREMM